MKKDFRNITEEAVLDILLDAMDDGEWHTPGVGNIVFSERFFGYCSGTFDCRRHGSGADERYFEISSSHVAIWSHYHEINDRGQMVKKRLYRRIYNFGKIMEHLNKLPDCGDKTKKP